MDSYGVKFALSSVFFKLTIYDKISSTSLSDVAFQRDCLNYIRVLQVVDDERLYVCGTHAFQPQCDYLVGQCFISPSPRNVPLRGEVGLTCLLLQNLADFSLGGRSEDGRGKCSFDPSQSFTTVMVGELRAVLWQQLYWLYPVITVFGFCFFLGGGEGSKAGQ